jgi:hypothetical protein
MPDVGRILDMLERDDALELDSHDDLSDEPSGPAWPSVEEGEEVLEVDYARLFPAGDPTERGDADFEIYSDGWILSEDDLAEILGEVGRDPNESRPPGWDVWAWYRPIHYFGPNWGIYIRETGLKECARRIGRSLPAGLAGRSNALLAKALIRAAFGALFLHEQYHHKTESAALRMHVIERRAIYPDYHRLVYRATRGTKDQIEEGLANADSWDRLTNKPYSTWTGRTVTSTTKAYLERSFRAARKALPAYANAENLLYKPDFDAEEQLLFAQVQMGIAPTRPNLSEFAIAS